MKLDIQTVKKNFGSCSELEEVLNKETLDAIKWMMKQIEYSENLNNLGYSDAIHVQSIMKELEEIYSKMDSIKVSISQWRFAEDPALHPVVRIWVKEISKTYSSDYIGESVELEPSEVSQYLKDLRREKGKND